MSAPARYADDVDNNEGNGSMAGGFLSAIGCAQCWASDTGLVARVIVIEGLIGVVLAAVGLQFLTECSARHLVGSYGLGVYRVLLSPLIADRALGGLFAIFFLWQMAKSLESNRGSIWFAFTIVQISVLTNVLVVVIGLVFGYGADSKFMRRNAVAGGLWPAMMGLMAIECMQHPEQERTLCCIPGVRAKWHPLFMTLLMSIFMLPGLDFGMLIGLGLGYAMHYRPSWQLSAATSSRWEGAEKMRWMTQQASFRKAAVQGGGSGEWAQALPAAVHPGRFATVHGAAAPAPASASAAPSVFTGQGHRLGDAPTIAVMPHTTTTSGSSTSTSGEGGGSTLDAQAEARRQRAAAIDRRMGKAAASSASANSASPREGVNGSTASSPSSTAHSVANAPSRHANRPSSPSGLRSSSGGIDERDAERSSMFTLGLDDFDDEGDDNGNDDLEQQHRSSAALAHALAEGEGNGHGHEGEAQGYAVAKSSKTKAGYGNLAPQADDDDDDADAELGLSGVSAAAAGGELADPADDADNASESTAMQTQR